MADLNIRPPLETPQHDEGGRMTRAWRDFYGTLRDKLNVALSRIEVEIDAEIVDLNITGRFLMDDVVLIGEFRDLEKIKDIGAENIDLSDDATIGGNLSVTGGISGSTAELAGTLVVSGHITGSGDITVDGDVDGATATIAGAITGASIDVTGEVGGNTLDIAATADIDGTLDVGGILTAETSADVVGALTAGTVASDATVSSTTEMIASGELRADNGVLRQVETTPPTPVAGHGYLYTTSANELFWIDGDGNTHLLHGDAFSDLWYHGPATPVAIAAVNTMALINIMENVRAEDDGGNAVGSTANNNITIGAGGAGVYLVSWHASITVAGGAKKQMLIAAGLKFATPRVITDVTDNTVSPIVVTSVAHGILNGDMVEISGVGGNAAAIGSFRIDNKAPNTFELVDLDNGPTTGSGDYTSGGLITHCYPGDTVAHRVVNQTDIGSMSATGAIAMVASDEMAAYVANVADGNNLSVVAISLEIVRIGD